MTHCKGRLCLPERFYLLSCRRQSLFLGLFSHFSRLTVTCVLPFHLSTPSVVSRFPPPSPAPLCLHPPLLPSPLHLVTMQIYLSPLARKTGFSEAAASAAAKADRGPTPGHPQARTPRPEERKTPTPCFTLNLQKTSQSSTQDLSSYKSPTKSPSQYFQICY